MQIEDNQEIRREVRDYVISSFYVADSATLADSASLIETGIIDSTGVLELVAFLESTYGVKVGDDEMLPENLDSIARVARFVCRKKAEAEADLGETIEEAGEETVDEIELSHANQVAEAIELDQVHPG